MTVAGWGNGVGGSVDAVEARQITIVISEVMEMPLSIRVEQEWKLDERLWLPEDIGQGEECHRGDLRRI